MIIQCLFNEVQQCYISSKMSPNQNTVAFKYYCTIEFVYVYHVTTSLAKPGISLTLHVTQKALHWPFFPLLLIAAFGRTGISFFSNTFLLVTHSACDQDRTYLYDMSCAFIPYTLGKDSNAGFRREHMESCPSTTKSIISPLPQYLWSPNLAGS